MDQHATLVLRLATTHLFYRLISWPFFFILGTSLMGILRILLIKLSQVPV